VWGANSTWAEKNRDAVNAFARNYKRGVQWLYNPANKDKAVEILVRYAKQNPKDCADAYDFYLTKLKLFGLDGDVSDAVYEKMADGLADIGIVKKPYPPKSAIFEGSFVKAAASH
jgi:ABC-type nitrate/sulfonate/bicarbonate transport system substrate-binding protein